MDPKELLKLLDLNEKPARLPDASLPTSVVDETQAETRAPKSPTALEVDEWGLRRGRDLVAESERIARTGADAFAAADFFSAAFEPSPKLTIPPLPPLEFFALFHPELRTSRNFTPRTSSRASVISWINNFRVASSARIARTLIMPICLFLPFRAELAFPSTVRGPVEDFQGWF